MAEEAGDYRTYLSGFDERCYFAIYRYSMHCFLQDHSVNSVVVWSTGPYILND